MCAKHWYALPQTLRDEIRKGTEKGMHSLRVQPSREWLAVASKHVGEIKHLVIRVGFDQKVKRNFQAKPQEEPSAISLS